MDLSVLDTGEIAGYDNIKTMSGMAGYALSELGYPVINIEIHPQQMSQAILSARLDFTRYNSGEGDYPNYAVIKLAQGESEVSVKGIRDESTGEIIDNFGEVFFFESHTGLNGINTLFSAEHILLYDTFGKRNPFSGAGSNSSGMVMSSYESVMMYLKDIKRTVGDHYRVKYIPGREILKINPAPKCIVYGVVGMYKKLPLEDLYNNPLFRNMVVARMGMQWGHHIRKIKGAMPDGLTVSGDEILAEYTTMYNDTLLSFKEESEPPIFLIG